MAIASRAVVPAHWRPEARVLAALPGEDSTVAWRLWSVLLATLLPLLGLPRLGLPDEAARWLVYLGPALALPWIFQLSRHWSLDRWIGELSYPIYLNHLLVIGVVLPRERRAPAWTTLFATVRLSALILRDVEQPIDRWRQARARVASRSGQP